MVIERFEDETEVVWFANKIEITEDELRILAPQLLIDKLTEGDYEWLDDLP